MKRRKANCTDHILHRNCLLKHVTKGKIEGIVEVMVRSKIRTKERALKFKRQKALDGTLWRIILGKGYELVVR
jgi:hypothetical protein